MYRSDPDDSDPLSHDLMEAYGNLRVSVLAMGAEQDPRAKLGWLVFVERSAARLEQVLADAERRNERAPQHPANAAVAVGPVDHVASP